MHKKLHRKVSHLLAHDNPKVVIATKESIHALHDLHVQKQSSKKSKIKGRSRLNHPA